MSFIADLWKAGYWPLQALGFEGDGEALEQRDVRYAVRIKGRDLGPGKLGHFILDEDSAGDVLGGFLWPAETRPIPGWAFAWPAVMTQTSVEGITSSPQVPQLRGMVPVHDELYADDDRFKNLKPVLPAGGEAFIRPECWPYPAAGSFGIALDSTQEGQQDNLFYQTDPRLIAANAGGHARIGSVVADLFDKTDAIDQDRCARLQSQWRVVGLPGKDEKTIAWQLGPPGRRLTTPGANTPGYGHTYDLEAGNVFGGSVDPNVKTLAGIGIASVHGGGPLLVTDRTDQHIMGETPNKEPIAPLHFSTEALWKGLPAATDPTFDAFFFDAAGTPTAIGDVLFANGLTTPMDEPGDGPLLFEGVEFDRPPPAPFLQRVTLGFNRDIAHDFGGSFVNGRGKGVWHWAAHSFFQTIPGEGGAFETPPNPPNDIGEDPAGRVPFGIPGMPPLVTTTGGPTDGPTKDDKRKDKDNIFDVGVIKDGTQSGGGNRITQAFVALRHSILSPYTVDSWQHLGAERDNTTDLEDFSRGWLNGELEGLLDRAASDRRNGTPGSVLASFRPPNVAPPVRDRLPGDPHQRVASTVMEVGAPAFIFRPQNNTTNAPDFTRWASPTKEHLAHDAAVRPVSARLEAFGGRLNRETPVYTEQPCKGRYRGGTTDGGVIFLPPEVAHHDFINRSPNGFDATGYPYDISTTYINHGPKVRDASATFALEATPFAGWTWGREDVTGDWTIDGVIAGTAATVLRLDNPTGRVTLPVGTLTIGDSGVSLDYEEGCITDALLMSEGHALALRQTSGAGGEKTLLIADNIIGGLAVVDCATATELPVVGSMFLYEPQDADPAVSPAAALPEGTVFYDSASDELQLVRTGEIKEDLSGGREYGFLA